MVLNCDQPLRTDLITKIIEYESLVFNEFIQKRTNLIKKIKKTDITKLNKEQLTQFVCTLKDIIDPIKNTNDSIENYLSETNSQLNKSLNTTLNESQFIYFYLCFKDIFFRQTNSDSESLSESDSLSDSVSESLSLSVSESLSVSSSESE
jgi:hypothetical protein